MTTSIEQAIIDAAVRHGVDPTTALTIYHIEDPRGDPAAQNPKSNAVGIGQFMPSTAAQYGLTDRTDVASSADAMVRYIADNTRTLTRSLGRAPTLGETYLAYQQGAGGALKLLNNPNAPATSVVGEQAVTKNGGTPDMTAAQFAGIWTDKATQVASTIPPANIPDVSGSTSIGKRPFAAQIGGLSPTERQELNNSPPVPLAPALKNVSGSPDERAGLLRLPVATGAGSLPPIPASAYAAPGPSASAPAAATAAPATWTSPQGRVYRVGDVLKTGNGGAGESNYVITPNGPQKLGYTPANTGPTVMSGIVGKVAQQAVSQAQQAIPAAASNAAGAVGSFFGNLFGGGAHPPAVPPPLSNNGGWSTLMSGAGSPPALPSTTHNPAPTSTPAGNNSGWGAFLPPSLPKPFSINSGSGATYTDQGIAGTVALPAGVRPQAYVPPIPGGDDPSSWGYIQTPKPVQVASLEPMAAPAPQTVTEINPAFTAWMNNQLPTRPFSDPGEQGLSPDDRDSPNGVATAVPGLSSPTFGPPPSKYIKVPVAPTGPAAPTPVMPLSPPPDELAALRAVQMTPLQRMFGATPLGHIASFAGNIANGGAHYGDPSSGGLLSMLTGGGGGLWSLLAGHTTPAPQIASMFSALTPQQRALQNPAAMAAGLAGQGSYSAPGGGLVPVLSTNGQVRNSYGDEANHLGSSLTQSWF